MDGIHRRGRNAFIHGEEQAVSISYSRMFGRAGGRRKKWTEVLDVSLCVRAMQGKPERILQLGEWDEAYR